MKNLIILTGPTAVGKTALALKLAQTIKGEIISADSMQIYKGMDIATAKPSLEEIKTVPHHLIDILAPQEEYSVAQFQKDAQQIIEEISARGHIPIIAGGTGLYIKALLSGYAFPQIGEDQEFRKKMLKIKEQFGGDILHKKLQNVDPKAADKLHPNDKQRIIRALEINHLTAQTLEEVEAQKKPTPKKYNSYGFVLFRERDILYDRINRRVDEMIARGLLEEAQAVLQNNEINTALQALGYKEFIPYFNNEISLTDAIENLKTHTRRYAKRQLTWFRHQLDFTWLDMGLGEDVVLEKIKKILKKENLLS